MSTFRKDELKVAKQAAVDGLHMTDDSGLGEIGDPAAGSTKSETSSTWSEGGPIRPHHR